jgi:predicted ATPase
MDIEVTGKSLPNLGRINVLVGKNGSGKSSLLRLLHQDKQLLPNLGLARYITPERGGLLDYEGNIATTLARDPTWGENVRRSNRYENFRQMSLIEFRRLETPVFKKDRAR